MPILWSEDMIDAVITAYDRFLDNNNGQFTIEAEKGTLTITHAERNGRHDYGPDASASYYCTYQGAMKVAFRWRDMTDNKGKALPMQFKYQLNENQINLILEDNYGNTVFNFHVSLMTPDQDQNLIKFLDQELEDYSKKKI